MVCDGVPEHRGLYGWGYTHLKGTHPQNSLFMANVNVLDINKNDVLYLIYWVFILYSVPEHFDSGE